MKGLLSFGFPFFLRVIIPGIVGTLALSPLVASIGIKLELDVLFTEKTFTKIGLLFVGLALLMGFLLYFLDIIIYRFFEGYIGWPKWAQKYFTNRLNKKIKTKLEKAKEAKSIKDNIEERKLRDWLMRFPLKEGRKEVETEAVLPTRMGNILLSYENYPESRYEIDAIFCWPRLWLTSDSETRKVMDLVSAEADCITYTSFILLFSAVLSIIGYFLHYFNIPTEVLGPIGKPVSSLAIGKVVITPFLFLGVGIILLIFSRMTYLLSLSFHVRYGNYFQSLFDLNRDKLEKMQLTVTKKLLDKGWEETQEYLRYGQKKCNKCAKYFPSYKETCPYCDNH